MTTRVQWFAGVAMLAAILALPAAATAQTAPAPAAPTFSKDVAPILQRSCQTCHRQGEIAPMALTTYQEVRPWARSIKNRVVARDMPPFHVDRTIGIQSFKDDPSLSDDEIQLIARWVDAGAPQGNAADMPPPRTFAKTGDWQIGEPDLVIKFPPYPVAASRPGSVRRALRRHSDRRGPLHPGDSDAVRDPGIAQGRAPRPVLLGVQRPTTRSRPWTKAQFLVEYASGKNAEVYPEGSGVLLQKGQRARLSYHLHSIGKETRAEVELGIKLYPEGIRAASTFAGRASSRSRRRRSTFRRAPSRAATATPSSTSRRG